MSIEKDFGNYALRFMGKQVKNKVGNFFKPKEESTPDPTKNGTSRGTKMPTALQSGKKLSAEHIGDGFLPKGVGEVFGHVSRAFKPITSFASDVIVHAVGRKSNSPSLFDGRTLFQFNLEFRHAIERLASREASAEAVEEFGAAFNNMMAAAIQAGHFTQDEETAALAPTGAVCRTFGASQGIAELYENWNRVLPGVCGGIDKGKLEEQDIQGLREISDRYMDLVAERFPQHLISASSQMALDLQDILSKVELALRPPGFKAAKATYLSIFDPNKRKDEKQQALHQFSQDVEDWIAKGLLLGLSVSDSEDQLQLSARMKNAAGKQAKGLVEVYETWNKLVPEIDQMAKDEAFSDEVLTKLWAFTREHLNVLALRADALARERARLLKKAVDEIQPPTTARHQDDVPETVSNIESLLLAVGALEDIQEMLNENGVEKKGSSVGEAPSSEVAASESEHSKG